MREGWEGGAAGEGRAQAARREERPAAPGDGASDPLWYRDAIIYQIHVKAFFDSDGDGIGDFAGLRQKLDYLQELGVTALWLLPFYPSPLKDDGYDIADYTGIHPSYGDMQDFRAFLREAHERGLRVITELVVNHTSDAHAWFQRARRAKPGSAARDFYVWSDTPEKYAEARIIFKDFEHSNWAWDPVAKAYFWHRFYSHQPDLNYDNPQVRKAVHRVMDAWFEMGVDGMRLDAIPYLVEREGTNCENLPETHAVLKELRAHLDEHFENRMLLAEANQWPEDAAAYFGAGDECHMNFHFPLMPRLFMSVHMEDRFPIIDILKQTPPIPETAQWAIFLRNHDELTLEMVTDEERDYMYRVYASDPRARINLGIRRRLAPLLENNRRKIELMTSLLLSLPGTPVVYYGDEIGMGDNIYLGDRNGVRTPMQWSGDRNAGFSRANPQRLFLPVVTDPEYHYESVNVEAQQNNPSSLLWWTRRVIQMRKHHRALSRGTIEFLQPENRKVLAFVRELEEERILVVVNLSRFTQYVRLDLSAYGGAVPVELFGQTEFPPIGEEPYFLTLGPHTFYWFSIVPEGTRVQLRGADAASARETVIPVPHEWQDVFRGRAGERLEALLPFHLRAQRWFRGKARPVRRCSVVDVIRLDGVAWAVLLLVRVDFVDGESDTYVLPLGFEPHAGRIETTRPAAIVTRVRLPDTEEPGALYDTTMEPQIAAALLGEVAGRRALRGMRGQVRSERTGAYRRLETRGEATPATVMRAEQSNTSIVYGDRWVLKLFRRLEDGVSLDLELGRYLTDRAFPNAPGVGGTLEYRVGAAEPRTMALLQQHVANEGDAWKLTLDELGVFLERASAWRAKPSRMAVDAGALLRLAQNEPSEEARELIGAYLELSRLLGRRTAELHAALSGRPDDPAFAPEPFTVFYQRSLYQSLRNLTGQVLQSAGTRRDELVARAPEVGAVLDAEEEILARFARVLGRRIHVVRIRTHGDYHLGQVLFTGKDFVITDFEGEPARPLSERRMKRSALRDVAGMLRSFHYAVYTARFEAARSGVLRGDSAEPLEPFVRFWYAWAAGAYLRGYLEAAAGSTFLPADDADLELLLDAYLLEKAVYELGYELNNRPDWVVIPARGILQLLRDG